MFNGLCYWLNVIGLANVAAWLRETVHRRLNTYLPTAYQDYADPDAVGYQGWGEMKYFGVLWFVAREPVGHAQDGSPLYNLYRW